MTSKKIYLIGLPASGKTTFGRKLALELNLKFFDLDEEVVKSTGASIHEIFSKKGEDHFRELERGHLRKILSENDQFVLATGGGTPCFFDSMEVMNKSGATIFLNTPLEVIAHRLKGDTLRPLMKKIDIQDLRKKRKPWYELAHHTVSNYAQLRNLF